MTCPMCDKDSVKKYHPFCSKKCADLDLGKWLTGGYAIPAADDSDDEDGVSSDYFGDYSERTKH